MSQDIVVAERCVRYRKSNMLDSLTWILNITGAVLGIAGTLVLGAIVVFAVSLVRRLPLGIRRLISALAAAIVAMTLFKGIAEQSLYVFFGRTILFGAVNLHVADIVAAVDMFVVFAVWGVLFVRNERLVGSVMCPPIPDESYCVGGKKPSSSSFCLKVSSVILQ